MVNLKEAIIFIQLDEEDFIEGYCLTYKDELLGSLLESIEGDYVYDLHTPLLITYKEWDNISSISSKNKEVLFPVMVSQEVFIKEIYED